MNAITEIPLPEAAEDRTATHIRLCQELLDLAMQLTRAAAAKALREYEAAETETPGEANTKPHKGPDQITLFTRLATTVRQAIALEARLTAGPSASPRASRATIHDARPTRDANPDPYADPRLEVIARVLDDATKNHPRRRTIHETCVRRILECLTQDPNYEFPAEAILVAISDEVGIEVNYGKLSDKTLAELLPTRFRPTPEQAAAGQAGYDVEKAPFRQAMPRTAAY